MEQLKKIQTFTKRRRQNWQRLRHALEPARDRLLLPEPAENSCPSWFGFLISIKEGSGLSRNKVTAYLEEHNIQTRLLFAGNLTRHPAFDQIRGTGSYRISKSLSVTDYVMNQSFWVGVYPGMTDEMTDYMASIILEAVNDGCR